MARHVAWMLVAVVGCGARVETVPVADAGEDVVAVVDDSSAVPARDPSALDSGADVSAYDGGELCASTWTRLDGGAGACWEYVNGPAWVQACCYSADADVPSSVSWQDGTKYGVCKGPDPLAGLCPISGAFPMCIQSFASLCK